MGSDLPSRYQLPIAAQNALNHSAQFEYLFHEPALTSILFTAHIPAGFDFAHREPGVEPAFLPWRCQLKGFVGTTWARRDIKFEWRRPGRVGPPQRRRASLHAVWWRKEIVVKSGFSGQIRPLFTFWRQIRGWMGFCRPQKTIATRIDLLRSSGVRPRHTRIGPSIPAGSAQTP